MNTEKSFEEHIKQLFQGSLRHKEALVIETLKEKTDSNVHALRFVKKEHLPGTLVDTEKELVLQLLVPVVAIQDMIVRPLPIQQVGSYASTTPMTTKVKKPFQVVVQPWNEFLPLSSRFTSTGQIAAERLVNLPDISAYNYEGEVSANATRILNYLALMQLVNGETEAIGEANEPGPESSEESKAKSRYRFDIKRGKVILEIKKPSVLFVNGGPRDLHHIQSNETNKAIVYQLATYLSTHKLAHGVITSYQFWWFGLLDANAAILYLTDAVPWDQVTNAGKPSVYQALATLFSLANTS